MNDILTMRFCDFKCVINQMIYENRPQEQKVRKLSGTQLEMIKKRKELKKR